MRTHPAVYLGVEVCPFIVTVLAIAIGVGNNYDISGRVVSFVDDIPYGRIDYHG